MSSRGNEVRVGVVTRAALLLLLAAVLWVGGFRPGRSRVETIRSAFTRQVRRVIQPRRWPIAYPRRSARTMCP